MIYNVKAECFSYSEKMSDNFEVEPPKKCPRCNIAWQPHSAYALYIKDNGHDILDVVWFCPNCNRTSISTYDSFLKNRRYNTNLCLSFPQSMPNVEFYNGIKELSPTFVKIYQEANNAECYNLFELAGMGYRKALEFLIKDYAIKYDPEDKQKIESMNLSECVSKYISHPDTAEIVKRTIWIANDQTHYAKLHSDMGLEDLKNLLELSVNFITMDLRAKEAMKITPKPKT